MARDFRGMKHGKKDKGPGGKKKSKRKAKRPALPQKPSPIVEAMVGAKY